MVHSSSYHFALNLFLKDRMTVFYGIENSLFFLKASSLWDTLIEKIMIIYMIFKRNKDSLLWNLEFTIFLKSKLTWDALIDKIMIILYMILKKNKDNFILIWKKDKIECEDLSNSSGFWLCWICNSLLALNGSWKCTNNFTLSLPQWEVFSCCLGMLPEVLRTNHLEQGLSREADLTSKRRIWI